MRPIMVLLTCMASVVASSYPSVGEVPRTKHDAPRAVHQYNDAGVAEVKIGNYESGLKLFDLALALDPENPDVMLNIVNVYAVHWTEVQKIRGWDGKKMYDESLRLSRLAIKSTPGDFSLWMSYGMVFVYAEDRFGVKPDWSEAVKVWGQARDYAQNNKQTAQTWLWEARAHRAAKNPEKALACLQKVMEINPKSAESEAASRIMERMKEEVEKV